MLGMRTMDSKNDMTRLLLACLAACSLAGASVSPAPERVNLALGKPYTWSVEPNYALTLDADDRVQLTDGKYTTYSRRSSFWGVKSSVGWSHTRGKLFLIIDLGRDQPISGFSYSTAGGASGVGFPRMIPVSVSTDGEHFYPVAELSESSPLTPEVLRGGYYERVYSDLEVQTHGRYVMFYPAAVSGAFVFLDELEVYQGEPSLLNRPLTGQAHRAEPQEPDATRLTENGVRMRMLRDVEVLRGQISRSRIERSAREALLARLGHCQAAVKAWKPAANMENFRAVLPLNQLHARIWALLAELRRLEGAPEWSVQTPYRYAARNLFTVPSRKKPEVEVNMLGNEYRGAVFQVTNFSAHPVKFSFRLPDCPVAYEVRRLDDLDSRDFNPDEIRPLMELQPHAGVYHDRVAAGMSRQIWVGFRSGAGAAGQHRFDIFIEKNGRTDVIPVRLNIASVALPDQSSLRCGMWDYVDSERYHCTETNKIPGVKDMREHGINVTMGGPETAALVRRTDAAGNILERDGFEQFECWTKIFPDAQRYQIFLALHENSSWGGIPGSAAFNRAVGQWAASWDVYLAAHGFRPGQVQLNLLDEPATPAHFQLIAHWAGAIKEHSRYLAVWINPVELPDDPAVERALALSDTICPVLKLLEKEVPRKRMMKYADAGKSLETYQCGESRTSDVYHRLQSWKAFYYGAEASHFWAYYDSSVADMWNEYHFPGGACFAVSCISPDGVVTTKRMEALREGLQDYEYFRLAGPSGRTWAEKGITAMKIAGTSGDAMQWLDQIRKELIPILDAKFKKD